MKGEILDDYDKKILSLVEVDYRISAQEISREVNLSRLSVSQRIRKLKKRGVIQGFTIIIDPNLVGLKKTVFVWVKSNPREPWLVEELERLSECQVSDGITGEYGLLMLFKFRDDLHFTTTLPEIDNILSKSVFKKYRITEAIKTYKEYGTPLVHKNEYSDKSISLDGTDYEILRVLSSQWMNRVNHITLEELSSILRKRQIADISKSAVYKRVRQLEDSGVIQRFSAVINQEKVGLKLKFYVRIKGHPSAIDQIVKQHVVPSKEVTDLHRLGEEYGLLAGISVRSVREYNDFIRRLYNIEEIIDTNTMLVLEKRKYSHTYP
ncbi:MAG: Lrp/AsnC family transcriptional regulator [Candidatus Hodarchaeota archaeon]